MMSQSALNLPTINLGKQVTKYNISKTTLYLKPSASSCYIFVIYRKLQ